jgi:8-amino-7-oxononanoate synthase
MTETHTVPVAPDLFEKVRGHERAEILEFARREDLVPYFRQVESEAGPVVTMEGAERLMLGSNNYLGLTGDPRVKQAAQEALSRYGTALTGSRLMNGTLPMHHELESEIAAWFGSEDALVFTTGYQANLGCLSGILGASDTVVAGSSEHASILDGCKLSGARFRPFKHKRFDRMETMLERAATDGGGVLVVVDGVYSMEGDICDVARVADAAQRYGARFMVDEAHSVGVLGERGTGVCELYGIEDRVDLRMGTFSKSLASCGGFIAGSAEVIDYLRIAARPFLFTASAVPSATAAALEAVRICRSEEGPQLFAKVMENAGYLHKGLLELGFKTVGPTVMPDGRELLSPVVPVVVGEDLPTVMLWKALWDEGMYTNVALHPAVAKGGSLIRTSVMATHQREHLDRALAIFEKVRKQFPDLEEQA